MIAVKLTPCRISREIIAQGREPYYPKTPLSVAIQALRDICQHSKVISLPGGHKAVLIGGREQGRFVALELDCEVLCVNTYTDGPARPTYVEAPIHKSHKSDEGPQFLDRPPHPDELADLLARVLQEIISDVINDRGDARYSPVHKRAIVQILNKIARSLIETYPRQPEIRAQVPVFCSGEIIF